MSSFFVSNRCIDAIVSYLTRDLFNVDRRAIGNSMGRALQTLNNRALVARYGEEEQHATDYVFIGAEYSPADVLKQIDCLLYQCSEGDAPKTDLFRQLDTIRERLAFELQLSERRRHPDYEAAPWG